MSFTVLYDLASASMDDFKLSDSSFVLLVSPLRLLKIVAHPAIPPAMIPMVPPVAIAPSAEVSCPIVYEALPPSPSNEPPSWPIAAVARPMLPVTLPMSLENPPTDRKALDMPELSYDVPMLILSD